MAFNQKDNSEGDPLPNTQPQAPQSIPMNIVEKDEKIGRNNEPYNPGGEGHGTRITVS